MTAAKRGTDIDYSKSTMAFPMPPQEEAIFVDTDIDYAASTGAYPMYDDLSAIPERVVEHVGSDRAEVAFPTPGPVSQGAPEVVAAQRRDLGLDEAEEEAAEPQRVAKVIEPPPEPEVKRSTPHRGRK